MQSQYALDKSEAKLMGVCAGLARSTGLDPLAVRLGLVLATLVAGPIAVVLYVATGYLASDR